MAMQLRVEHRTGYHYASQVTSSYNEARMSPVSAPGQLVLGTRIDVSPSPWSYQYRDYWGTVVTAFEVHDPHRELLVSAVSTVQVDRRPPTPAALGWDALRDPALVDAQCEFLEVPGRVAPGADLADRVAPLVGAAAGPTPFAREVCGLVHDHVDYVVGSTEVHSTAEEAWQARQGVCQDMAHLCVGALRSQGVPARYVSGYLHPAAEPQLGEPVAGESHAWIQWWDGAWVSFDPTNQTEPDDRYVTVGIGRDYTDVAPLTGIFSGGQTSAMFVEVTVTRVE